MVEASAAPAPWFLVVSLRVRGAPAPAVLGAVNADTIRSVLTWATLRVIVVVLVRPPDTPVIVTLAVPVAAVLLAANVNVLAVVAGFGSKEAVTPLGRPDADKLTLLLKPFCGMIAIVAVPLVPCVTLRLVGDAESV